MGGLSRRNYNNNMYVRLRQEHEYLKQQEFKIFLKQIYISYFPL